MEKRHYKIPALIFILIAAIAVIFLSQKMQKSESTSYIPSPAEAEETLQITSVISPEGKMTLSMKSEKVDTGTKYSFSIKESESNIVHEIYARTVLASAESKFSIPANTFSPDNKYVFLKETNDTKEGYFVLLVDSSLNSQNPIDISIPFATKYPELTVTDVTGWGGINLVVINTNKANGAKGPSFWFDVPSNSFIQLSNRFD
jgi:hypothetical protein